MPDQNSLSPDLLRRRRVVSRSQFDVWLGLIGIGVLVAGIFWWGGRVQARTAVENPPAGVQLDPGQAIYIRECAACHGNGGVGNPAAGVPALNQNSGVWEKSPQVLEAIILEGKGTMPGYADSISREDLADLLAWIRSLWTEEQRQAHLLLP